MPIPIDEGEEIPTKIFENEMDIIDFLEQTPKLAYSRKELVKKLEEKFGINNILMKVVTKPLFAMDLEIMFQKGYIRKIKKNNEIYYFFASKP
ncbi:MAG: hypothetical protein ACFFDN_20685 [Candidatus Hodarchaeota archaeon]